MQVTHVFGFEKYHLEHWTLNESSSVEALFRSSDDSCFSQLSSHTVFAVSVANHSLGILLVRTVQK